MNFDFSKYGPYLLALAAGAGVVGISYFIPLKKGSAIEIAAEEVIKAETGETIDLSQYEKIAPGS